LRSIFFEYDKSGSILSGAKGQVPIRLRGWRDGGRWGKLGAMDFPVKHVGTNPLKFSTPIFIEKLRPALRAVVIDVPDFIKFLKQEGAENNSWTLRFWEIKYDEGWSRTITIGKEIPDIAEAIVVAMNREGRGTTWAGAEFTHSKLGRRVMVHRWPTAAIAPWGVGGPEYLKIRERFANFLRRLL